MGIVRRIILFLGAGASTCFGYPTTKQFIDGLRAELAISSAAEVQLLNKILSIQGFSDVEHVLELLDLLQSVNRHPFTDFIQTYPSVINFGETASSFSDLLHSAKRLRDKIQEDVFRQYEFNPDSLVKINDVYSPLIQNLMANNIERYLSIFTTNYDRVIESFCINK